MGQTKVVRWYAIISFILIGFVLFVSVTYNNTEKNNYHWRDITEFNEGWSVLDEGESQVEVTLPLKIKRKAGETYTIKNQLSLVGVEGNVLSFKSDHLLVKAFVEGEEIYSLGVDNRSTIGKSPGVAYVFIPLKKEFYGKTISIEYTTVYASASFHISEVSIGEKSTIITGLIRKNFGSILLCAIIFILGILFIFCYYIKRNTYNMNKSLLYLGIFALPASIWSGMETQVMQFFISNVYALQYVTYLSLILVPVPFLLYYAEEHGMMKKPGVSILSRGSILVAILCLSLQAIGKVDLPDSVILVHLSIASVFLYVFYHLVMDYVRGKKSHKFTTKRCSTLILLLCMIVDILRYYAFVKDDYSKYVRIGFACYLVCIAMQMLLRSVAQDKEKQELEHIIYTDSKTGLQNDTAYERMILELNATEDVGKDFALSKIQMLELGVIADEFGNKAKEQVIRITAKMVERAFYGLGAVFHVGEGEFIVHFDRNIDENYKLGVETLTKRVNNSNRSRGDKIVFANGFIKYEKKSKKSVDEVLHELEHSLLLDKKNKKTESK